ncbi:Chromatin SPT2 [Penicillium herquei]|nr:Chromatin SPT2 [Penicillium herquei]
MSFLDSVLSSLQTGKASPLPISQPPAAPAVSATNRDGRQPALNANTNGGIKRKAEEQLTGPTRPAGPGSAKSPVSRPVTTTAPGKTASKPASNLNKVSSNPAPKLGTTGTTLAKKIAPNKPAPSKATTTAAPTAPTAPTKAPPKGSFADLMAQAKAMQDKAPKVGVLQHHQTEPKARNSHREFKQRLKEAKKLGRADARTKKLSPQPSVREKHRKRTPEFPSRKSSPESLSYKGTAKPTQTPEPPAYRGTAGLPGKTGGNDRRQHGKHRKNEYLGTDEEDEGEDYGYDDGFYSDVSSDMEAGFNDVEEEDRYALKNARKEDEEELRQEMAAKKEKMERQKRLAALASRKR